MINSKSFSYIINSTTNLSSLRDLKMNCIYIVIYYYYYLYMLIDNEIGDEGMKSMSEAYNKLEEVKIRSFYCSENGISDVGLHYFITCFPKLKNVSQVVFYSIYLYIFYFIYLYNIIFIIDNQITNNGIIELTDNFSYITKLCSLSFSGTLVHEDGLEYLMNNISTIKYLNEIYMSSINNKYYFLFF